MLTEEPAFVGCLNTFRSYGAKLVGIPMEQDGMNINALEETLKANPDASFYTQFHLFRILQESQLLLRREKKCMSFAANMISQY